MRKILFRAKTDEDESKWVKGVFIPDCLETIHKQQLEWGFIKTYKLDQDGKVLSKTHQVQRHTVGQYTGIRDEQGKRIWEGDILQRQGLHKLFVGKVVYKDGAFMVEYVTDGHWDADLLCMLLDDTNNGRCTARKIGNVFDNPELLVW